MHQYNLRISTIFVTPLNEIIIKMGWAFKINLNSMLFGMIGKVFGAGLSGFDFMRSDPVNTDGGGDLRGVS